MVRSCLPLFAACAAGLLWPGHASTKPVSYQLPDEVATLAPGPNMETAAGNCGACHSVDYISTQPRDFADPRAFWTGEVTKMQKAYGAVLAPDDAKLIVDYLVATYGK